MQSSKRSRCCAIHFSTSRSNLPHEKMVEPRYRKFFTDSITLFSKRTGILTSSLTSLPVTNSPLSLSLSLSLSLTHTHTHTHTHTLLLLYCFRLNEHATPSGDKHKSQKSFPMHINAVVYCMASFASKILLAGLAFNGSFLLMYRFFSFSNVFVSLQVTNASEASEAVMTDNSL